jgi:sucrose-6-phosphate hydrolase SacC (GH32 family)
MNVTASFSTDYGVLGWTAAGIDETTSRVLQVGWLSGGSNDGSAAKWCPDVQGIKVCGVQALSTVRVLEYIPEWAQLTAYPPAELSALHNGSLANETAVDLKPSEPHQLALPAGSGAAMDLVVRFALPADAQATAVNLSVAVFDGSDSLRLAVSSGAARTVTILDRPKTWSKAQFTLEKEETELEVRVLVDRSITEWFVGRGRMAVSRRVYPPAGSPGAFVSASAAITMASAEAHDMACGWV